MTCRPSSCRGRWGAAVLALTAAPPRPVGLKPSKSPDDIDRPFGRLLASCIDDRGGGEVALRLQNHDGVERLRAARMDARALALPPLHTPTKREVSMDRDMQPSERIDAEKARHSAQASQVALHE